MIYTVHLLQNENDHREYYYQRVGDESMKFDERQQQNIFHRLMEGVKMFNAQPEEKQEMTRQLMKSLKANYGKV